MSISRLIVRLLIGGVLGAVMGIVLANAWLVAHYGLMMPKDPELQRQIRLTQILGPCVAFGIGAVLGVGIGVWDGHRKRSN